MKLNATRPNRLEAFFFEFPALQEALVYMLLWPLVLVSILWSMASFGWHLVHRLIGMTLKRKRRLSRSESIAAFPQNIVITGASSGIGHHLALEYAAPNVYLALFGRNQERLKEVARQCSLRGAKVETIALDVVDVVELERRILQIDNKKPIDLVFANAGVVGSALLGKTSDELEPDDFIEIMKPTVQVNFVGAIATFSPLLRRFMHRERGQIALVSSIAALAPMPVMASYSASKAALTTLGLNLRPILARFNVKVNVICPGFVDTNMTAPFQHEQRCPWYLKPALMVTPTVTPEYAARVIRQGLAQNQELIIFPLLTGLAVRLVSFLPYSLRNQLHLAAWKNNIVPKEEVDDY